jgi:hypothetical protein
MSLAEVMPLLNWETTKKTWLFPLSALQNMLSTFWDFRNIFPNLKWNLMQTLCPLKSSRFLGT